LLHYLINRVLPVGPNLISILFRPLDNFIFHDSSCWDLGWGDESFEWLCDVSIGVAGVSGKLNADELSDADGVRGLGVAVPGPAEDG